MEGGREHGHDAVRAYWTRQFGLIDSRVEPVGFETLDDGRVAVRVHQVVRSLDGRLLPLQVDGDYIGEMETVSFGIDPQALQVIA